MHSHPMPMYLHPIPQSMIYTRLEGGWVGLVWQEEVRYVRWDGEKMR